MNKRIHNLVLQSGYASAVAFTLLEVLVAVAALALLAVGVAAIFDTTGKTVQAGRRVSAFSSYAAIIEQQFRQDIASMTREGFLVIRNQYADTNANGVVFDPGGDFPASPADDRVAAYDGDPNAKLRRVDELLFFAKGRFRTSRELLDPRFTVESDAARIYYGHGRRRARPPGVPSSTSPYLRPQIDDTFQNEPNTWLGYRDSVNVNPNRYASDWTLLRHVTLLVPPRTTTTPTPAIPAFAIGANDLRARDSDVQIALQPAASNIFRRLNVQFPLTLPQRIRSSEQHPAFASGLVDIATTDLAKIRSIVMTTSQFPVDIDDDFFNPDENSYPDESNNRGVDGIWRSYRDDPDIWLRMHAWMDEAFPANTMANASQPLNQHTRIRYEPAPNNYVGVARDYNGLQEAYLRADQLMLASSNFLPRCTEFIVEWSMGNTFPSNPNATGFVPGRAGEVIWFGMERLVDGRLVAAPYANSFPNASTVDPAGAFVWAQQSITVPFAQVNGSIASRPVPKDPSILHGGYDALQHLSTINNYFGWQDPTFDPENPTTGSGSRNGLLDQPNESASPTIDWPWPKMIRITLSLADPRDPSIEQTFQFVFDVPAGQAGR
jgi:type II secretory pathway pseudopilin PulG